MREHLHVITNLTFDVGLYEAADKLCHFGGICSGNSPNLNTVYTI